MFSRPFSKSQSFVTIHTSSCIHVVPTQALLRMVDLGLQVNQFTRFWKSKNVNVVRAWLEIVNLVGLLGEARCRDVIAGKGSHEPIDVRREILAKLAGQCLGHQLEADAQVEALVSVAHFEPY